METASIELSETEDAEVTAVLRWRFTQLCLGGFPPEEALRLAGCFDVDLHEAVRLLRRGCPARTAVRILL